MDTVTSTGLPEDSAWASFNTSLSVAALKKFCSDIERLFRINPMLEFKHWQVISKDRIHLHCINSSQEQAIDVDVEMTIVEVEDGFEIMYSNGIKTNTHFKIEPTEQGSKLTITENYRGLSKSEQQEKLNEVDKSIVIWANYLQRYLSMWQRWSRFAVWRWYIRKVWQPMKPSGRRITYMLLWISALEIALISLGFAIYYIEFT
ncbi:MAG: hypothetical protein ACC653_07780 [Gammaproteobacteria bacterium]